ncbi:hypothetical protein H6503_04840 [Candidatus Woesearchaeota archaeon]|nr:hypothetical protein [Candidatus Woesearchaeota archaeon]
MKEISFCPYCSAPSHKLLNYHEDMVFCRDCNTFFRLNLVELKCPKCEHTKIEDSDFPSPDGQVILQCKHCKKMFTAKDLIEK